MSVQGYKIKGIGYLLDNKTIPPIFDKDKIEDWCNTKELLEIEYNYYRVRDMSEFKDGSTKDRKAILGIVTCPMGNGKNNYFIGYILYAHKLENTHGDEMWTKSFRSDDYIKSHAGDNIESAFGIEGEPSEIDFEYWG